MKSIFALRRISRFCPKVSRLRVSPFRFFGALCCRIPPPSLRLAAVEWSLVLLVDFFAVAHGSQMRLTSSSSSGSPQMRCRRPPHGPQQENSGVVVLSLSWHNSPTAHGMVCRQVLAAARNTQRVVLCCVQQRVRECAAAGGAPRA